MSTPHNQANHGDIAETVLLPGDPLRAKFIAETFLTDVKQFNATRNAFGYTGKYNGKEISVMGTGMGCPSIGIYSYELIEHYGVKNLVRIGSCGSMTEGLNLYDIVIGMGASTNSNFGEQYHLPGTLSATCSYELLKRATDAAEKKGIEVHVGDILSSDIFYYADPDEWKKWARMGILAVEMESYALYCNAKWLGANALCMLTVSDSLVKEEYTTAEEREKCFTKMMEIALEL